MERFQIAPGIYSVGVLDWSLHDFHGFEAPRGVTYNAYLIVDEKIALIDSVKHTLTDELFSNISTIIDPAKIDYVVTNHAEPDHSSGLPAVMKAASKATVVCTARCRAAFDAYYGGTWPYQVVKTGDTLSLGKHTLNFIATPMVHWPDSMATYLPSEKILFSMDAFGQHIAGTERYDDELPWDLAMDEARRYYANIITPLGASVLKVLDAVETLDLRFVAPGHGIIWRKNIPAIIKATRKWASLKSDPKVVIVYDSMWGSTELMARTIIDGISQAGAVGRLIHIRKDGRTEAAAELLEAACLAVGTPTLHMRPMPEVAGFLSYVKSLAPVAKGKNDPRGKGRAALAFGSHGWSGGGASWVAEHLAKVGYQMDPEVISCVYRPDRDTLDKCGKAGAQLARQAIALAQE